MPVDSSGPDPSRSHRGVGHSESDNPVRVGHSFGATGAPTPGFLTPRGYSTLPPQSATREQCLQITPPAQRSRSSSPRVQRQRHRLPPYGTLSPASASALCYSRNAIADATLSLTNRGAFDPLLAFTDLTLKIYFLKNFFLRKLRGP